MKTAVLVSGLFNCIHGDKGIIRNNNRQKEKFPNCDFFYATYPQFEKQFRKLFPNETVYIFEEPVPHYHPYLDIPNNKIINPSRYLKTIQFMKKDKSGKRLEWSKHHCKQHLIHARLCSAIKHTENYDIIVRERFDGFISHRANFGPYLKQAHETQTTLGFGATKQKKFDVLNQFPSGPGESHEQWLTDQLIIHPASFLEPEQVEILYNKKLLHGAESGWYQILSHGKNHKKHLSFDGWCNHTKNILPQFFV